MAIIKLWRKVLLLFSEYPFILIQYSFIDSNYWLFVLIEVASLFFNAGLSPTYLISYTIMFLHGLYAPHLSPFVNFHAEFLPNPMDKDHSFTLPLHIWNNLPQQIRTADNVNIFKSLLKTHLFNAVYCWLYLI